MSPDMMSRPTSPDGLGGGLYSSYTMGTGLEGLICASPPAVREHPPRHATNLSELAIILKHDLTHLIENTGEVHRDLHAKALCPDQFLLHAIVLHSTFWGTAEKAHAKTKAWRLKV